MITREPKPGEFIETEHGDYWKVDHCWGGICYSQANRQEDGKCFIYQFANGQYNSLHRIVGTHPEVSDEKA